MTGTTWIQESGLLEGPVAITNTHSVGVVRDAIIQWEVAQKNALQPWWLPVVAETYDGRLNDINGFHVKPEHVLPALDSAAGGAAEGRRGRRRHRHGVPRLQGRHRHGVAEAVGGAGRLHRRRAGAVQLRRAPRPAHRRRSGGRGDCRSHAVHRTTTIRCRRTRHAGCSDVATAAPPGRRARQGSIIVVVATDAPLLPHQLKRIATRVSVGVGRQGGFGGNSSGDIFVAFSTANARAWFDDQPVTDVKMLPNDRITPLFQATAQATEAAITNALLAAETTTGANDLRVYAMPVDRMLAAMKKYGRLP